MDLETAFVSARRIFRAPAITALTLVLHACASTEPRATPDFGISPADLVASLADVANGRNPDMAETGLALTRIELTLLVGHESRGGLGAKLLVLDVDVARRSEVSFTQSFTLVLPPPERKRTAAAVPAIPGVVEFVEAAMASARELAAAASRAGLPQKLAEVELVAKLVRSSREEGGVAFSGIVPGVSISGGAGRVADEANTVRLVFAPR